MSETSKKHKKSAPRRLTFGVFICSTSRYEKVKKGERVEDPSGDLIESLLKQAGHSVIFRKVISDDEVMIEEAARQVSCAEGLDAVVFCGGTGITHSDLTIETVSPLLEKTLPGFGEFFRRLSYDEIGSAAVLSRAIAGVMNGRVFFCIPGSPSAVRLCVEKLILTEAPHIVKHARE